MADLNTSDPITDFWKGLLFIFDIFDKGVGGIIRSTNIQIKKSENWHGCQLAQIKSL